MSAAIAESKTYADSAFSRMKRTLILGLIASGLWTAVVKLYFPALSSGGMSAVTPGAVSTGSQHVSVSAPAAGAPAVPVSMPRDWITAAEFAAMVDRDERTVISYIAAKRIHPLPVREPGEREWRIDPDAVLLPAAASAADSGNQPQDAADSR